MVLAALKYYLRGPAMKVPIVTLKQGQLKGKVCSDYDGDLYYSFLGIPYAKAPVGELRFADPQPPEPWEGTWDGTVLGPACPTTHMIYLYYVGKEDNCLNLNVFTKSLSSEGECLKPVLVWIHGGAYIVGSNNPELYNPNFLITEDIVLVTINYRLGPLGFLSLEDSSLGVPGNAGLKDQVMALRWVQENIRKFNGDPNNVTIFGESAGGASAHLLVLSPVTRGLFHKAIMQSGSGLCPWTLSRRGPKELCRRLNYKETDEKKILKYLRSLSVFSLTNARIKSRDGIRAGDVRYYAPVIEKPSPNAFLTDSPENILKSGNYNKVPMIMGYTSHEGFLFELLRRILFYAEFPIQNFVKEMDHRLRLPEDGSKQQEIAESVKRFYYEDKPRDDVECTVRLKTDTNFLYPIQRAARYHRSTSDQPLYLYELTLETDRNFCKKLYTVDWLKSYFILIALTTKMGSSMLLGSGRLKPHLFNLLNNFSFTTLKGAAHGDDIGYLFDVHLAPPIKKGSVQELGMRRFVKMWTNFAKYGNPTPLIDATVLTTFWKPIDDEMTYMDIGEELVLRKNPRKDSIDFWDKIFEYCGTK